MECLHNLLQISKNGCDCLDIDMSLGSLFLDSDVEGKIPLSSVVINCEDASKIELLTQMRNEAFNLFNQSLLMRLSKNGSRYPTINGTFPQKPASNATLQNDGYYYLIIKTKAVKGLRGSIAITADNGEDVYFITENGHIQVSGNIDIESGNEYVFYYQATQAALNKKPDCGCGHSEYKKYLSVAGGTIDNPANITSGSSQYVWGFKVQYSMWCDALIHLCDGVQGWKSDPFLITYLYGVLYQWRKSLAYWILTSGQVTNYLTTNGEEIPALIELYDTKIDERIAYLSHNYGGSDCLNCGNIMKGQIII